MALFRDRVILGSVAVPLGFLAIGIAWVGVSGSGLPFERHSVRRQ